MNRIPIIIQGAGGASNGGSGGSPTGGASYELSWVEENRQLVLTSSDSPDPQVLTLTGIDGVSSDVLNSKQDKLTAGTGIKIEKDENTNETVISCTGGSDGGITEEMARQIASDQITSAITNGEIAKPSDIPQNISDLNNDAGFVEQSDLDAITGRLDAIDTSLTELEEKVDNAGAGGTQDPITVSPNVGNIPVGKTYPPGTTLVDIIKDFLDPPVPPTFVAPKLTITGSESNVEIGAGQSKTVVITLTFDRGSISTGGYRAGEAIEYSLNGGAYQTGNTFSVTVSESNKSFKGKVRYGAGDQPKDSKGEDYGEPLEAGEVESGTLTYKFASPVTLWSNAANITVVAKEPSVNIESKTHIFQFAPQTEENPEIFDVPEVWNVTKIECINDITGQWQSVAGDFDVSTTTHDGYTYKRYTDNREYDDGGRNIRITWN